MTHRALLASLADRIDEVLAALVPVDRPVALLDFPHSGNVGDGMIWLGAAGWLRRRGIRPCYTCSYRSYVRESLAERIRDGTILLSGGGNFGDLYPDHQRLREAVAAAFPRNRIVQLPQAAHFRSEAALEAARRALNAHPDLVLLARDDASRDLFERRFEARVALCPDLAFALGPLPRADDPERPVLWLARRDKERAEREHVAAPPGVEAVDWLEDDRTPAERSRQLLRRVLHRSPVLRPQLQDLLSATYEPVARERLARGVRILSRGRVVVTDRLHGHVLALLLGIPHVLLDNTYGKVRGLYEAWTRESPLASWCDDESRALERALEWAASGTPDD